MGKDANLKGKIIRFTTEKEMMAVVETELGEAFLDVNTDWDNRLRVGDTIEVEGAGWYITDGHIVTILGQRYTTNGANYAVTTGDWLPLLPKEDNS